MQILKLGMGLFYRVKVGQQHKLNIKTKNRTIKTTKTSYLGSLSVGTLVLTAFSLEDN
jgi:hypothetical protein